MKRILSSVVALAAVGAVPAFAEEAAAPVTGKITPEAAVLPENVMRFRAAYGAAWGDYGWDKDGKKTEKGVKVNAAGGALVFEYGLTERLSMQVLAPFKTSSKLEVSDEAKFRSTVASNPDFVALRAAKRPLVEAGLVQAGLPQALIDANGEAPMELDLAAVGLGKIAKGEKVSDGINRLFLDAGVASAKKSQVTDVKFATGLGDVELGLKYSLSTEKEPWFAGIPFYTSVAGGVRLPTGAFKDAQKDGKQVNGRGTTDVALRLNADYLALHGVMLQVENQTEVMAMKGKYYTAAKDVDYERDGMRNVGYAKVVVAPGAWVPAVDLVSLSCKYSYDYDAKVKVNGVKQTTDATQERKLVPGLSLSGFGFGVPAQLDVDYNMPFGGKNVAMATSGLVGTLKLFYKF